MANQLNKVDKVKIQIRKDFLQYARKKIDNIQIGDMDSEEYEVFRQEISEIIDFLANKDKYMEAMQMHKMNRNKNISKYFKEEEI